MMRASTLPFVKSQLAPYGTIDPDPGPTRT